MINLRIEGNINRLFDRDVMRCVQKFGLHLGSLMARHVASGIVDVRELRIFFFELLDGVQDSARMTVGRVYDEDVHPYVD